MSDRSDSNEWKNNSKKGLVCEFVIDTIFLASLIDNKHSGVDLTLTILLLRRMTTTVKDIIINIDKILKKALGFIIFYKSTKINEMI